MYTPLSPISAQAFSTTYVKCGPKQEATPGSPDTRCSSEECPICLKWYYWAKLHGTTGLIHVRLGSAFPWFCFWLGYS
ncbi:hypothetical protein MPTK1_6g14680 [Marchantia polymorpha subsp. ruderalis]|uniref:Uncharacterized protein n=2 Tax=Marchantia polymorpha TaxID=3197 RepID=A0AAF6BS26_MARPO|nr:hypothetical protein MARPO_0047s0122 [Marchantia polymorpha]BBN14810.1 hypothetical protein Mp_6g14680 [Marchantia polymorpha subsp. ruderalis]|eukprot:PTQ39154.1 hypothetical protein MARPO_0047s0122 [Marchantia polymorpha]